MPGHYNNYSLVADTSTFNPYQSMQEMLTPFVMYKDAFEKQEAAYDELNRKAGGFKYLADTLPEGSRAREIYEGYAKDLEAQAKDFSSNGLNMSNRRALLGLKRRYQGEIGRLEKADEALQEQRKLRSAARANGQNLLYAEDNLSIDQFLDNQNPNLYSVNADELRKEGAQYAQAASSRIYGDTRIQNINKYFQDIIQTQGYSPEVLAAWRQNLESIPEFNQAVNDILEGRQVNGNLTGRNLEIARQNVINGIMEGSAYQERRSVQQNPGVLTAAQAASNALGWANHNLSVAAHGMVRDKNGKYVSQDEWMYTHDENGRRNGYSNEYIEAVKKGLVPGKNVKMGNGNNSTATTTKATNRKLKEARQYNGSGVVSPVTKNQKTTYGKKISYAEALTLDPSISQHDPGYEDYYEYFNNGGLVTVVPLESSVKETPDTNSNTSNASSDDNQI